MSSSGPPGSRVFLPCGTRLSRIVMGPVLRACDEEPCAAPSQKRRSAQPSASFRSPWHIHCVRGKFCFNLCPAHAFGSKASESARTPQERQKPACFRLCGQISRLRPLQPLLFQERLPLSSSGPYPGASVLKRPAASPLTEGCASWRKRGCSAWTCTWPRSCAKCPRQVPC